MPDSENIIFLDCTRLDGSDKLVSRNNINDSNNVYKQIEIISKSLIKRNINKIILADDVVFSGNVLRNIIKIFKKNNVDVIGIRSCISTTDSYDYFNNNLPLGIKCDYLLGKDVIDQICERDFYFGIAQSGISIKDSNGLVFKAPYFKPYGNPIERASIPSEYEKYFSEKCINRSLWLWNEIEKLSERKFYIRDLPEKINLTNDNDSVVKTLKKGLR